MRARGHVHVIPVDGSLSVIDAWKEICIFGRRITNTGHQRWATVRCDGQECRLIDDQTVTTRSVGG